MVRAIDNLGGVLAPGDNPSRIALIDFAGEQQRVFSFGALSALADAVARGLARRFSRPGFRVVILSENSAEFVALYFGVMRAGGVAVPVSFKFSAETLAHVLADCAADLVFADQPRHLPTSAPAIIVGSPQWREFLDAGDFEPIRAAPGDLAQILYTSGSTGQPKGVPLTHAGQIWAVEKAASFVPDAPSFRVLVAAPMFHMNALFNIKRSFHGGSSVVLLPQFRAADYVRAIELYRADWVTCVPTMMAMLMRHLAGRAVPEFAGVRRIFMSSSSFSPQLLDSVQRLFPKAAILNSYGTTEAGPHVFEPHPDGLPAPPMSVGYAGPDMVRLVDQAERVITDAGEGVLEMKTPAIMPGYLNRPELSAGALRDGWYHSRDVMRRDEQGFFYFISRSDDMFTCGGENIYPIEVEQVIEKHPEVEQAIVVSVADEVKQALPFAFVVRRPGSGLSEAGLKAWFIARAPAYMHPRGVSFISEAPLAQTNKIDRAALTVKARDLLRRDAHG